MWRAAAVELTEFFVLRRPAQKMVIKLCIAKVSVRRVNYYISQRELAYIKTTSTSAHSHAEEKYIHGF